MTATQQTSGQQTSGIRKALGLPESVEFQGQTWPLEPLTFLDLADAEALGLLNTGDKSKEGEQAEPVLSTTSILWLMLRKADPSLTDTQRDLCQYTMTPRETRAIFGIQSDNGLEGVEFMAKVIAASGLSAGEGEQADGAEASAPKKGRGAREYKPKVPATPIAE